MVPGSITGYSLQDVPHYPLFIVPTFFCFSFSSISLPFIAPLNTSGSLSIWGCLRSTMLLYVMTSGRGHLCHSLPPPNPARHQLMVLLPVPGPGLVVIPGLLFFSGNVRLLNI